LFQVGLWANDILAFGITIYVTGDSDTEAERRSQKSAIEVLTFIGRLAPWKIIVLVALDNIAGIEITSLIAGLGVTGVAVALAVQNILGD